MSESRNVCPKCKSGNTYWSTSHYGGCIWHCKKCEEVWEDDSRTETLQATNNSLMASLANANKRIENFSEMIAIYKSLIEIQNKLIAEQATAILKIASKP